ncbi:LytR family transcriptional regulator [Bacillus sp. F19]|nr:LytR family transcriptional regulator [Bacillus sp. F19]
MKKFDELPKSIKKTIRYINQDVNSIKKLEHLETLIDLYIQKRKKHLSKKA